MTRETTCPKCESSSLKYISEVNRYLCLECTHLFDPPKEHQTKCLKIFLSYGHDIFAEDALILKEDLERRGHQVWYDMDQLRAGSDYEMYIEKGLQWSDLVVILMTPHSVRREPEPGYCLNEIAYALGLNKRIVPVLLVYLTEGPPVSITRLDFIDMRDCIHFSEFPEKYRSKFTRLIDAIENEHFETEGAQSRLLRYLKPLTFEIEMGKHLPHFTGREWVTEELDRWLCEEDKKSRVFWILGGAGIGKSAIASHWCHTRGDVIAYHLCVHGHSEKADPKRILLSLAAQISMHLPEYFKHLSALPLEDLVKKNAKSVFDDLLFAPLKKNVPHPGRNLLVIIDALDEASFGQDNELADFIAASWGELPNWLRLVVTSRPETAVVSRLRGLQPWILKADRPENTRDIRQYLTQQLKELDIEPSDFILDQLEEKSEGMFLYARVVINDIRSGILDIDDVSSFPQGMASYYKRWFNREFPDPKEYQQSYSEIISVIATQRAPLPLNVLADAVGLTVHELRLRLQRINVFFPLQEGRSEKETVTYVVPMHKTVCEWLTSIDQYTQIPVSGPFSIDISRGNKLLAEAGWKIFLAGHLHESEYFKKTVLQHLSQAEDFEHLKSIMFDPGLLENLWLNEYRLEWQRHLNSLRYRIPLIDIVHEWNQAHNDPGACTFKDAIITGKLAHLLQEMGASNEAMLLAQRAIEIWESNHISNSGDMVDTLLTLGKIQFKLDQIEEATKTYQRAHEISLEAYSHDSPEMAHVFYELNLFYNLAKNDYETASKYLEASFEIRSRLDPPDYAGMADCLNDKAVLRVGQKYADFISLYKEALSWLEKGFPGGHPEMVTILCNIGNQYRLKDLWGESTKAYQRALSYAEDLIFPQHDSYFAACRGLVEALVQLAQIDEALKIICSYLAELDRFPGLVHNRTFEAYTFFYNIIYSTLTSSQDSNKSGEKFSISPEQKEKIQNKCFEVIESRIGSFENAVYVTNGSISSKQVELILDFYNQIQLLSAISSVNKCEPTIYRILSILEKLIQKDHTPPAKTIHELEQLINSTTKLFPTSERLMRKVINLREVAIAPDHPDTLGALLNLADLLEKEGRLKESREFRNGYIERAMKHLDTYTPTAKREVALQLYITGDYDRARKILTELLEKEFQVPSTRIHLARIALMTDNISELKQQVAEAKQYNSDKKTYVLARILWMELVINFLEDQKTTSEGNVQNIQIILGRLKKNLENREAFLDWSMEPVLEHLKQKLTESEYALIKALAATLSSQENFSMLNEFPIWLEAAPLPFD